MGVGKSTLGKKLANKLAYTFVDTDQLIVEQEGLEISEIFSQHGEEYFRSLEKNIFLALKDKSDVVISTGGGLPCNHSLIQEINKVGVSIHLTLPFPILLARLEQSHSKRPLLANKSAEELKEFTQNLLETRNPIYEQADIEFDTKSISATRVNDLVNVLKELD